MNGQSPEFPNSQQPEDEQASLNKPAYDDNGVSLFYNEPRQHILWDPYKIPRLRLGTVDDVHLTFGDKELAEYIRTETESGAPFYLFDQHNFAFYGWMEALKEGRIESGSRLLHFDSHSDSFLADNYDYDANDLRSVRDYTDSLRINGFIAPALQSGLVTEFLWVHPEDDKFDYYVPSGPGITKTTFTRLGIDSAFVTQIIENTDPKKLIVDIDADFFDPHQIMDRLPPDSRLLRKRGNEDAKAIFEHDISRIQSALEKAGVVTFATSPGYIAQDEALLVAKRLLKAA